MSSAWKKHRIESVVCSTVVDVALATAVCETQNPAKTNHTTAAM